MVRIHSVNLQVENLDRAAGFWSAALGYEVHDGGSPVLAPPGGDGPALVLDTDDRTHIDLSVADEAEQRSEVERLTELGARAIDGSPGASHVVLADPDGNLFCVVIAPS